MCSSLTYIGKTATNNVINTLISALGDQDYRIRHSACVALRNIGDKAGTNDVINKLVITVGDRHETVENVHVTVSQAWWKSSDKRGD